MLSLLIVERLLVYMIGLDWIGYNVLDVSSRFDLGSM